MSRKIDSYKKLHEALGTINRIRARKNLPPLTEEQYTDLYWNEDTNK